VTVKLYYNTADPDCKVEYHGAITSVIRLFIKPLENSGSYVRPGIFEAIDMLANHGE
jgi:hypothetical protein